MNRDTEFYNNEATKYSIKRYPETDTDFVHFAFKKRKRILMRMLAGILKHGKNPSSLLDMGCADGVVTREIAARYPEFCPLYGSDISPAMIAEAKHQNIDKKIEYFVRGEEEIPAVQTIVEIGVVAREIMESELCFAYQNLPAGGYYICSIASRTSLRTRLKADESDLVKYLTFSEYETAVEPRFEIVRSEVFGLFIPYLWKVPFLARLVQPICEILFRPFLPSLFHEKIYLMRRRTS